MAENAMNILFHMSAPSQTDPFSICLSRVSVHLSRHSLSPFLSHTLFSFPKKSMCHARQNARLVLLRVFCWTIERINIHVRRKRSGALLSLSPSSPGKHTAHTMDRGGLLLSLWELQGQLWIKQGCVSVHFCISHTRKHTQTALTRESESTHTFCPHTHTRTHRITDFPHLPKLSVTK